MKEDYLRYRELLEGIRFYTIAFTLRCGSNLLCDYLSNLGVGSPTEFFQWPYAERLGWLMQELGVPGADTRQYMQALISQRSVNQVFGCKMTWDHRNVLIDEARKAWRISSIDELFPGNKWIFMRRRDKYTQAISLWRASKSGRWTSKDRSNGNDRPEYDYFRILQCFSTLLTEEQLWSSFFERREQPPLTVWYEDLAESPMRVLSLIVSSLGMGEQQLPFSAALSDLERLRDKYTEELRERFIEDLSQTGVASHWKTRAAENERWENFFHKEQWKSPAEKDAPKTKASSPHPFFLELTNT